MEYVLRHGNRHEYGARLSITTGQRWANPHTHAHPLGMAVRVIQVRLSKMTDALSCLSSFEKQIFHWEVRTVFRD